MYEGVSLNTACAAAESFLDLDISCVLVVDDRRTDLGCCFLMRYGSFLESFECHERVYFSLFYDGFVQGHGLRRDVIFFYLAALAR